MIKAIGNFVPWKTMEVRSSISGKPYMIVFDETLEYLNKITDNSHNIHISLSDEPPYAQAFVIICR